MISTSLCTTGFIVEKKSPGGDWQKVNTVPTPGTTMIVPDLTEGEDYEFRVRGVNPAGEGDPSLGSSPVTCKDKKGEF